VVRQAIVYCDEAPVAWGTPLLLVFALAAAVYVGGGVVAGRSQAGGSVPGLEGHPHHRLWDEGRSLVLDGFAFAKSGGKRRGAAVGAGETGPGGLTAEKRTRSEKPGKVAKQKSQKSGHVALISGGKDDRSAGKRRQGRRRDDIESDDSGAAATDQSKKAERQRPDLRERTEQGGVHSSMARIEVVADA
jgi:hypothetical protein